MTAAQGITEILQRPDVTLEEFLLNAAPAFHMFSHLGGVTLPERFEPDTEYQLERLREAAAKLTEARAWTREQAQRAADESYAGQLITGIQINESAVAEIGRLKGMRDQLAAWDAPSLQLRAYKHRLLETLDWAIVCAIPGHWAPTRQRGSEYRRQAIKQARKEIRLAWKSYISAIRYAEAANRWVTDLKGSFAQRVVA
jgi:hypothetical protein